MKAISIKGVSINSNSCPLMDFRPKRITVNPVTNSPVGYVAYHGS